ncbi:MAG: peptidylprolyl isomerase, partial [Planctomycetota bacterium]
MKESPTIMFTRSAFLLLLILLSSATACRSTGKDGAPGTPDGKGPESIVIAVVDGEGLTLADAMGTFTSSHSGHGALVQGEPAVRELAGRTIERRLFLAEAEALGLREDPYVLAAVEDHKQTVAQGRFWTAEVDDKVSVSDEDVEAFYAKTDVALSVSLIEVGDADLARALRERVLAGEDFNQLAQEHSIHESSVLGGLLTYVRRGEMDMALEQPSFDLQEVGELTDVVQTENGWAFVRLDERTVNAMRPDRAVIIPQIRSILKGRAEDELRDAINERVEAEAGVVIHEHLLTKDALLGSGDADVVIAESAGDSVTLGEFRDQLDLGAVGAAPEEAVAEAALGMIGEWAHDLAMRQHMETTGRLEDPVVLERAAAFHEETMLDVLYERYVYADVDASEEQIRGFYDEHVEDQFTRPAKVRLAYIVVPDEEAAMGIIGRLDTGEDFGDIARELSIDKTSAMHGGRIGWIAPGELVQEVEERAFALMPGSIDGPILTEAGVFVINVLERDESEVVPYIVAKKAAT